MTDKTRNPKENIEKIIGRPLNESDKRRQAQREAGYKGWIDKEGNPTKGSGKW